MFDQPFIGIFVNISMKIRCHNDWYKYFLRISACSRTNILRDCNC